MCALKNNFISSMAGNQKSLDIDTISVRNIFVKGTNNSILTANYSLLTDGKGGTQWVDIAAISTGLTFRTFTTTVSTFTSGPGNTQFSILDGSNAGLKVSGSGNSVSLYAKAFGQIDISGQNSIYSFDTVTGTINSNVEIVGSGTIDITTDTNANKIQFYSPDTGLSSISTMVSNFVHLNGSLSNTISSFNSPFSTFIYNAISSFSTALGQAVRYNEMQSSISSFSTSLGQAVRYNEMQSSISSFSTSLGQAVRYNEMQSSISSFSTSLGQAVRYNEMRSSISSFSTSLGQAVRFNEMQSSISSFSTSLGQAVRYNEMQSSISSFSTSLGQAIRFNEMQSSISSFSTSLGQAIRFNEMQSSISSFSTSLGQAIRFNEMQSSISSFSTSLGPVVNLSQVFSTMSSISSAQIVDINNAISSYSTLQGPLVTTFNFSSVLSTQNYIEQLKTGTLNTSTIQQQGLVQPAIQYGFSTLDSSGTNLMTLSTNYINGNYAVQLSYTDTSSGVKPLSSSTISSSNFTVYGDNNAKIHWTTFGNLF